jgi:hypothetical protein
MPFRTRTRARISKSFAEPIQIRSSNYPERPESPIRGCARPLARLGLGLYRSVRHFLRWNGVAVGVGVSAGGFRALWLWRHSGVAGLCRASGEVVGVRCRTSPSNQFPVFALSHDMAGRLTRASSLCSRCKSPAIFLKRSRTLFPFLQCSFAPRNNMLERGNARIHSNYSARAMEARYSTPSMRAIGLVTCDRRAVPRGPWSSAGQGWSRCWGSSVAVQSAPSGVFSGKRLAELWSFRYIRKSLTVGEWFMRRVCIAHLHRAVGSHRRISPSDVNFRPRRRGCASFCTSQQP